MHLIRQLRELGAATTSRVSCLNCGGCCVYAAHVGRRLRDLGIDVWSIYTFGYGHVLLQFKYKGRIYTHDSKGTHESTKSECRYDKMTLTEAIRLANKPDEWNSSFDRESGIPIIRKHVKHYLSKRELTLG